MSGSVSQIKNCLIFILICIFNISVKMDNNLYLRISSLSTVFIYSRWFSTLWNNFSFVNTQRKFFNLVIYKNFGKKLSYKIYCLMWFLGSCGLVSVISYHFYVNKNQTEPFCPQWCCVTRISHHFSPKGNPILYVKHGVIHRAE